MIDEKMDNEEEKVKQTEEGKSEKCNSKEIDNESMSEEYEEAEHSIDYSEIQEQQLELRKSTRVKRLPGKNNDYAFLTFQQAITGQIKEE